MISLQMLRGREKCWPKRRHFKRLDDFKNVIVSLIISPLCSSKLYNFDPYNNKCKSFSLDKLHISGSRL